MIVNMKGILIYIVILLLSITSVFALVNVGSGENPLPFIDVNPISIYGKLIGNNNWTGNNTFDNVIIYNLTILQQEDIIVNGTLEVNGTANITGILCFGENSDCYYNWTDVAEGEFDERYVNVAEEYNITISVSGGTGSGTLTQPFSADEAIQVTIFPTTSTNSYNLVVDAENGINNIAIIDFEYTGNSILPFQIDSTSSYLDFDLSNVNIDESFTVRVRRIRQ